MTELELNYPQKRDFICKVSPDFALSPKNCPLSIASSFLALILPINHHLALKHTLIYALLTALPLFYGRLDGFLPAAGTKAYHAR
jgi:hypothetical protein